MAGAFFLGVLFGLANLVFVAFGLHAYSGVPANLVFSIGFIPAILTGAAVGLVAGGTRSAAPLHRRIAIAAPALAVVALLGSVFSLERFILIAWIPTFIAALALEQSTRAPRSIPTAYIATEARIRAASWIKPILLGVVLGWTNILVDMLALALSPRCFTHQTAALMDRIELFALIPAIAVGAGLGALAHSLRTRPIPARRLTLITLAIAALCLVAAAAKLDSFAFPASFPVTLFALVLERLTRAKQDALPTARVHIH